MKLHVLVSCCLLLTLWVIGHEARLVGPNRKGGKRGPPRRSRGPGGVNKKEHTGTKPEFYSWMQDGLRSTLVKYNDQKYRDRLLMISQSMTSPVYFLYTFDKQTKQMDQMVFKGRHICVIVSPPSGPDYTRDKMIQEAQARHGTDIALDEIVDNPQDLTVSLGDPLTRPKREALATVLRQFCSKTTVYQATIVDALALQDVDALSRRQFATFHGTLRCEKPKSTKPKSTNRGGEGQGKKARRIRKPRFAMQPVRDGY